MFDIGFWEIILISVIGLIVLGPERLPIAIRSVVRWINTLKEMANAAKTEMSRELKLHELHENMHKAAKQEKADPAPEQQTMNKLKQAPRENIVPEENKRKDLTHTAVPAEQEEPTHDNSQKEPNIQDKTDEYK